jgi:phosphatidylglycerol:prolipoprotein diacylglycerol transferase
MAIDYPHFDPVALHIGPLAIRWYALSYIAGFILGWRVARRLTELYPDQKPSRVAIDDLLSWVMLGVIAGGRLGYVIFYKPLHYIENPHEILMLWQGGMSFHGGALGVIVAMFVFARRHDLSFLRIADIVTVCVPIGLFFGRLANFIHGEFYGRTTNVPWAVIFPNAGPEPRHPSQLYEAVLEGLVLFAILLVAIRTAWIRQYSGTVAGLFLLLYGVFRAGIEYLREPDAHLGYLWGAISMGQILSLPMILSGALVIAYVRRKTT